MAVKTGLGKGLDALFSSSVTEVAEEEKIKAKNVIVAPGRTGAKWVQELADKYKIPYLSPK